MTSSPAVLVKLLGVPALERADGTLVVGRAAQRHRIALLALLALAPDRRMSRDKVVAWLWPEADADRARNLLNVAVYVLRSALGDAALVSAGGELRLGPGVASDVAELEAAVRAEEWERAAALRGGPFLDGFFLADAPEFEQWAERERQRLAALYRRAVEALAEGAERAGRWADAVEWWRARAADDPLDSRVAVRLIEALEAGGNRAAALRHAADHQRCLAEELGMAPDPALAAAAERLRRAPAPAPATAIAAPAPAAPAPAAPRVPVEAPAAAVARHPRPRVRVAALLAVLVPLAVVGAAGLLVGSSGRAPVAERSIVVLPFVNMAGDSAAESFSDGLTEEVIARLSAIPDLKTISRTSSMHYKGTRKPLREIAGELGVASVLEGSVRESGGRFRITAQLIDARTDAHLWAESYDHAPDDPVRVQQAIASEVAQGLGLRLGDRERATLAHRGTSDPEAYRLYQRGRRLWNAGTPAGHEQALAYYGQAIARDSGFADAYAGLADAYLTAYQLGISPLSEAEAYSRIKWAAERALALDERSADAHVSFAVTLWCQRNWPGAERELRRALELNPGHAQARIWYALLLAGMGRMEEAMREGDRAAEVDPFSLEVSFRQAWLCYHTRNYGCAVERYRRAIELHDRWPWNHSGLGDAYAATGRYDEAAREYMRALELRPGSPSLRAGLARMYALAGRKTEAAELLHGAAKDVLRRQHDGYPVAIAYVALGQPDSAFAWLARADWRWPHRAMRSSPALDPIRKDPRFAAISARVDREMGLR